MMTRIVSNGMRLVTGQNLPLYRIDAFKTYPYLTHAIFTRQGGFSQAPFDSLNLGSSVGDDPQAVRKNFEQVCQAINIRPAQTVSSHLVHGADTLVVDSHNQERFMGKADGLITGTPGIYLSMRFADCTPLIFFDPGQKAIGLTHAGWRGVMQNVAGATVEKMVEQLGCRPKNMMAVIGPSIGPCCYEVGPEVITAAIATFTDPETLFTRRNGKADHAYFNMWEANRQQLAAAGVGQIIQTELCTACHTDQFFSHRAEKGRTGRFGVILGLEDKL